MDNDDFGFLDEYIRRDSGPPALPIVTNGEVEGVEDDDIISEGQDTGMLERPKEGSPEGFLDEIIRRDGRPPPLTNGKVDGPDNFFF